MRRLGTLRTRPIAAGLGLALAVAGCGLGDLPTRPPKSVEPPPPTASPSPTPVPSPTVPPTATPKPLPTPIIYTVKPGDSLLTIAKRFKTTGRSIAYWNRATYPSLDPESPKYDPNRIEVGWKLTLTPGITYEEGVESPPPASPTPQPSISVGPIASPPADGTGLLVTHGARSSNVAVLTFDLGGPSASASATAIVSWLIDRHVPASFFTTGQSVADPGTQALLTTIAAHPNLFTVGDGTWSRPDLTGLGRSAIVDQLQRADAAIAAATGSTTKPLFRPPDGAQNAIVRAAAAGAGFPYTVLWDVDPEDLTPESAGGPTADDIVTKVAAQAQPGSIVHLHLDGPNTLAALPGIVDALTGNGLLPINLGRLLGL